MSQVIDRTAHDCAEEIFNRIGTAINELQIYTEDHPRFRNTAERIRTLIQTFFDDNPETRNLTITIRRKQVEFRSIPFVNVNAHGHRLILALDESRCQGLQFKRGISLQELGRLIDTLIVYVRPTTSIPEAPRSPPDARYAFLYSLPEEELSRPADDEPHEEERPRGRRPHEFVPEFQASAQAQQNLAISYHTVMSSLRDSGALSLSMLQKATNRTVELITGQDLRTSPAAVGEYFDEFTVHHSMNVSLLTTRAASLVTKDTETLQRIAMGALLHDIGKSRITTEILDRRGRLDPDEAAQLKNHQLLGAEILLGLTHVDPLCVTIAYGHHLRPPDGTPPSVTRRFVPDWVTRLVAVTDVFETLTAVRPYKCGMSVGAAFQAMAQMATLAEHQAFVKLLYESLGPYPVGTFVELNSGERGVVLAMDRNRPSQPTVRILTSKDREALPEPLDLDLAEAAWGQEKPRRVARALVRSKPEDDLLDMVARPDPADILGAPLDDGAKLMEREG